MGDYDGEASSYKELREVKDYHLEKGKEIIELVRTRQYSEFPTQNWVHVCFTFKNYIYFIQKFPNFSNNFCILNVLLY